MYGKANSCKQERGKRHDMQTNMSFVIGFEKCFQKKSEYQACDCFKTLYQSLGSQDSGNAGQAVLSIHRRTTILRFPLPFLLVNSPMISPDTNCFYQVVLKGCDNPYVRGKLPSTTTHHWYFCHCSNDNPLTMLLNCKSFKSSEAWI